MPPRHLICGGGAGPYSAAFGGGPRPSLPPFDMVTLIQCIVLWQMNIKIKQMSRNITSGDSSELSVALLPLLQMSCIWSDTLWDHHGTL